jgi:peptide deformylase
MILPVRLFIDKVLHQPTELVTNFNSEELFKLSSDMVETMFQYRGIGLSCNQIGVGKNLAVLWLKEKTEIKVVANLMNICYNKEMGTDIQLEGCLSCPGVSVPMKRYLGLTAEAQLLNGEKIILNLEGYDARILQHEFQHTQGLLITQGIMKL